MLKSKKIRMRRRKSIKRSGARNVYIVIENTIDENCKLHPRLYNTYEEAYNAAIAKYKDQLDEERDSVAEYGGSMASKVDVAENPAGVTELYIEPEINITIHRFVID